MKFKSFKVYVDGRSEEIQKHLFFLGCKWGAGGVMVSHLNSPFLFVDMDKKMSCSVNMQDFKEHPFPELTADQALALTIEVPTEHHFNPFDMVLVRGNNEGEWVANIYSRYDSNNGVHICINGSWYKCIPYEGNEHLLGTTTPDAPAFSNFGVHHGSFCTGELIAREIKN